ncbi:MAG: hypothetical protein U0792_13240 [Gemmataceae bacterium]
MKKLLGVCLLAILTGGLSKADIGVPPGTRFIPTDHKIETPQDYPDYNFFVITGEKVTAVKLGAKTPLTVTSGTMHPKLKTAALVAVPKDAQKQFKSQVEFNKALVMQKVPGGVTANTVFSGATAVKGKDNRRTIVERWTVEKVNDKDGIILTPMMAPEKDKKCDGDADEAGDEATAGELPPTAYSPRGSGVIAGLAATVAGTLAGLWLAGRRRRNLA